MMPLYPFYCSRRHETEILCASLEQAPDAIPCSKCGATAHRGIGLPSFHLSWARAPVDTFKEAWEGTGLENKGDGINPLTYESKKETIDLGK